jgi:hypothetical protein
MSEQRVSRHPRLLLLLVVMLALECGALVAAACYLVVELLVARPDSFASAVALLVLVLLAAVWLGIMAVHTLRGRSWTRGGAITWQVLQIAVGIGSFQGAFARPDIGWLLIIPALLVLVLLFTPPVLEATRRRDSVDHDGETDGDA